MKKNYGEAAKIFKALSDETRLEIIDMLTNEELCAHKILDHFNITQPTLSYHMKILTDSGLVTGKREGALMLYHLKAEAFARMKCLLKCLSDETSEKNNAADFRESLAEESCYE